MDSVPVPAKPSSSALWPVAGGILILWVIFAVDVLLTMHLHPRINPWYPDILSGMFGIVPQTEHGLFCIPTAPLVHASIAHLAANSVGLLLLGWPSWRYSPRLTQVAIGYSVLYGGILTWTLGDLGIRSGGGVHTDIHTCHIGASGIIFGLIGFLIGNGLFRRGCLPLILGVATAVLFAGVLPQALPNATDAVPVSWQMHLGGLLGGLSAAWHNRESRP